MMGKKERFAVQLAGEPLMLDIGDLMDIFGLDSQETLELTRSDEFGPEPVVFNKYPHWIASELRRWIDAGLPDRNTWRLMEAQRR